MRRLRQHFGICYDSGGVSRFLGRCAVGVAEQVRLTCGAATSHNVKLGNRCDSMGMSFRLPNAAKRCVRLHDLAFMKGSTEETTIKRLLGSCEFMWESVIGTAWGDLHGYLSRQSVASSLPNCVSSL